MANRLTERRAGGAPRAYRRTEEHYKRRTLQNMWKNVARKKKALVDQAVLKGKEAEAARVTQLKDAESVAVRQQLSETAQALEVEKHAREMLAQDMKRSFMRGVCALNMEAMQVRCTCLLPRLHLRAALRCCFWVLLSGAVSCCSSVLLSWGALFGHRSQLHPVCGVCNTLRSAVRSTVV